MARHLVGHRDHVQKALAALIRLSFMAYLEQAGIGHVLEIADGGPPYAPRLPVPGMVARLAYPHVRMLDFNV